MTVDQLEGTRSGEEIDPTADPDLANALINSALAEPGDEGPLLINNPPDGSVTLPGGYLSESGVVYRATVRELCGEDEEELARPSVTKDFTKFIDTLLTRCVETVGDEPATRLILDDLLIGDREMLLQGIRITTYGDMMRLDLLCPLSGCAHKFQVDYQFSVDVPVRKLDGLEVKLSDNENTVTLSADRRTYRIPMRKGNYADVALITGAIQRMVYNPDHSELTSAELNTLLLQQCVQSINGASILPTHLRRMGSADRAQILAFLGDSQPGPQWGEVKQMCPRCDREFPLVVDVPTMFRGI